MGLIIKLLLVCVLFGTLALSADVELEMVIEVFRHGARGPTTNALPDKWTSLAELTTAGMRMHYVEGRYLRDHYPKLLQPNYNFTQLYTRSSNVNRTLQSAMSHYLGLYDLDKDGPQLKEDYPVERAVPTVNTTTPLKELGRDAIPNRYQPIPIVNVEGLDDDVIQPVKSCPILGDFWTKFENDRTWRNLTEIFRPIFPTVAKTFGMKEEDVTLAQIGKMYDSLYSDYVENNKTAITPEDPLWANMSLIFELWMTYSSYPNQKFLNLNLQPMFEEFIKVIDQKINGTHPNTTWYTYSAHDLNLLALLIGFKLTSLECQIASIYGVVDTCLPSPPFASLMLFEVWKDKKTNRRSIKMIYNGEDYSLCGGAKLCDYLSLKSQWQKNFYVDDWDAECSLDAPFGSEYTTTFLVGFAALSLVIILLVIGIYVTKNRLDKKLGQDDITEALQQVKVQN